MNRLHKINLFILLLLIPYTTHSISVTYKAPGFAISFHPYEQTPDLVFEVRLATLSVSSPVELDFNQEVKRYIELYLGTRKTEFEEIISRTREFFPIFDECLDRYNLPLELKYLTIVESGLNPLATSPSGAAGLWQFLFNTGELFDLTITSYIDERRDLYKSTEAACKYLAYLYNTFHDWHLVLSSYNGGPGEVRKAIERNQGETSYWKIRSSLSEQSGNYVPAFIAVTYLMNFYNQHGINPVEPDYDYADLDTLHINYPVSFEQIAVNIDMPLDQIRYLNPAYRRDFIPENNPWSVLVLPSGKIEAYLRNENRIISYNQADVDYNMMLKNSADTIGMIRMIHEVQQGEYTHKIAMKYNCTIEHIKAWNNLNDYNIFPGQELVIWVDPENQK